MIDFWSTGNSETAWPDICKSLREECGLRLLSTKSCANFDFALQRKQYVV